MIAWRCVRNKCRRKPGAKMVPGQKPDDLIAGTQAWVVEVIAPFSAAAGQVSLAEEMVKDLKTNVSPGQSLHYLQVSAKGKEVKVV